MRPILTQFCKNNIFKFGYLNVNSDNRKFINIMNPSSLVKFPESYMTQTIIDVAKKENIISPVMQVSRGSSEGDNFSGDIYRVNVTGTREQGGKGSLDLILKSTNIKNGDTGREKCCNDNFKNEIDVYRILFPLLHSIEKENMIPDSERIINAKFYYGSHKLLKEHIVMEDLTKLGFKMSNQKALDIDHISIIVKSLAKFHALTFALRLKDSKKFKNLTDSFVEFPVNDDFRKYFKRTAELSEMMMTEEEPRKRFKDFTNTVLDTYIKYRNPESTDPYNVICHGDCWFNNFLFLYENGKPQDVRILDWQMVKVASPVRDLMHLIFMCTDDVFRHNHYFETLELYFDSLSTSINILGLDEKKVYPRKVYDEHLKVLSPLGLMQAMIALPFVINNAGEYPDLNKIKEQDSEDSFIKYSKRAKDRMRGAIIDCIKYNII